MVATVPRVTTAMTANEMTWRRGTLELRLMDVSQRQTVRGVPAILPT
jgi:hypothetical protein